MKKVLGAIFFVSLIVQAGDANSVMKAVKIFLVDNDWDISDYDRDIQVITTDWRRAEYEKGLKMISSIFSALNNEQDAGSVKFRKKVIVGIKDQQLNIRLRVQVKRDDEWEAYEEVAVKKDETKLTDSLRASLSKKNHTK